MCEQYFSAISTSPVLKHVSAGHSRASFPQALKNKCCLQVNAKDFFKLFF